MIPELERYRTENLKEQQFLVMEKTPGTPKYTLSHNVIVDPQLTVCATIGCKRILRQAIGETRLVYCPICNAEAESLRIARRGYLEHPNVALRREKAMRENTYFHTHDEVSPPLLQAPLPLMRHRRTGNGYVLEAPQEKAKI